MTDLNKLDALYEAATDGPWENQQDRDGVTGIVGEDVICQMSWMREEDHVHIPYDNAFENAALIVALVNEYPGIRAELEALREAATRYFMRYCQDEAGLDGDIITGCSVEQRDDARNLARAAGIDPLNPRAALNKEE